MKEKKMNTNKIRVNKLWFVLVFFLFAGFIVRLCYLSLIDYKVGNSTISAFIKNRNTKEEIIMPTRGSIYDVKGNILAQDVVSYTVIAYLDESRSENSKTQNHVSDIENTAIKLSEVLDIPKDTLVEYLSKDAYQVELGPKGKNLSQLKMEEVKALNLPGIDFIKTTKRYYPNGDFASYMLGYTVFEEDSDGNNYMKGLLGIEQSFDQELRGSVGYVTYEKDRYGYKIANGREYKEEALNGDDIYLTIDNNVELFIENAVKKTSEQSQASFVLMVVADAKTGAILGYSSTPSFDPNLRNLSNYLDPIIRNPYEPGSTMKIFSYMCAIDKGTYKGDETYLSGSKTYTSNLENGGQETTTISDWKKEGWGRLTYDQGFALSSNIAVANMVNNFITIEDLHNCYEKYGFGSPVGIALKNEASGSIDFRYEIEAATAGYGQGIMTTPIQHIQALTAVANDGEMLKPYLVSKIKNTNTGKITFEGKKTSLGEVISKSTADKMKTLLRSVINGDSSNSTGSSYYMEGYDLIGKTGTAQIYNYKLGKYEDGPTDYIYSFSGLYPGENPEIIVYAALMKPKDTTNYVAPMVKEVVANISNYLNIKEVEKKEEAYVMPSFTNKNIETVKKTLEGKNLDIIILGDGDKVINQYPLANTTLLEKAKVILLTNKYDKKVMPDLIGYSKMDAINLLKMMNLSYAISGTGYVSEQSIAKDTIVNDTTEILIKLQSRY